MMSKFLAPALLIVCTLGAEVTPPSGVLAEEDVPNDEVTLLQSQVEVKKGEAKSAKQATLDEEGEPSYPKAVCSASESCESPASFKLHIPAGEPVEAEPLQKASQAPETKNEVGPTSKLTLGTVLQVLALLLIADVMRRCPWKASKAPAKAAAPTSAKASNSDPHAALLTAALNGDTAAFEAHIDSNVSQLSKVDSWGCSVLHYAAKGGSADIVQRLVDLGAWVQALDAWDETPLHLAARAGRVEACEILVNAGAPMDSTNAEDCTPLIVAGRAEHEAVCRVLISHGAGIAGMSNDMVPELVSGILKDQESLVA